MPLPKYARIELERRWLVDASERPRLEPLPCKRIEDKYLTNTRLRLRAVTDADGTVYKLCKKYGGTGSSEAMVNVYLTKLEYDVLNALAGHDLEKRRYTFAGGALDVFGGPLTGLVVFEAEFASEREALSCAPPDFVTREVTGVPEYEGATLAERGLPPNV